MPVSRYCRKVNSVSKAINSLVRRSSSSIKKNEDSSTEISQRSALFQKLALNEGMSSKVAYKKTHIRTDPSDKSIVLFGGEGSEYVGMAEESLDLPGVYEMYETAEKIFGFNVIDLTLNGPIQKIRTIEAYHVINFMANMAAMEKLKLIKPDIFETTVKVVGFGIGELNALVFSGMIDMEEMLKFIKLRCDILLEAKKKMPQMHVLSLNTTAQTNINFMCKAAREWSKKKNVNANPFCEVIQKLGPNSCFIGGDEEALRFINLYKKDFKILINHRVNYPINWYSSAMKPVQEIMYQQNATKDLHIKEPLCQVLSCANLETYTLQNIHHNLIQQIASPIKLEAAFTKLLKRKKETAFPYLYECSSQRKLSQMLNNINRKACLKAFTVLAN